MTRIRAGDWEWDSLGVKTHIARFTGHEEAITLCRFAVSREGFEIEELANRAAPAC